MRSVDGGYKLEVRKWRLEKLGIEGCVCGIELGNKTEGDAQTYGTII